MKNNRVKRYSLSAILLTSTIITIIILSILVAYIGYNRFTAVLEKQYNNNAYEIAEIAKTYLNPDKFDEYLSTGVTDEEYDKISEQLDNLTVASGSNFIYVAEIDPTDYLTTTYIYDSVNPILGFDEYELGHTVKDVDPMYAEDLKHILITGGRAEKYLYSYNEWGAHTTAGLAVHDSLGNVVAVIAVEKDMVILDQARTSYVRNVVLVALIVIVAVILLFTLFLRYTIINPITEIRKEAERFAKNHEKGGKIKAEDRRTEIGTLAEAFNNMEEDIIKYVDDLTTVTAEKERIGAELNVATQIQADMLPRIFPPFPDCTELDVFATMRPAKEVGGDFYDFFFVDDKHIALVMADVSGKGVPAALFMVIAKTLIKNRAQMGGTPAEILKDVNETLCEGNEAALFVTVWLAIIDITTGKGFEANAGHEHPAIKRNGGKFELVKNKHSIAVATMEGVNFRQNEIELFPGDRLFVYTDGVAEATNSDNVLYGTDRMLDCLNSCIDASIADVLKNVQSDIDDFVGEAPQFDDITMLCFDYYG